MDGNDVISQFCAITGQNEDIALQFLSMADFNIEQAIDLFFANGDAIFNAQDEQEEEDHSESFNSPKAMDNTLRRMESSFSAPPEDAQIVRVYSEQGRRKMSILSSRDLSAEGS